MCLVSICAGLCERQGGGSEGGRQEGGMDSEGRREGEGGR